MVLSMEPKAISTLPPVLPVDGKSTVKIGEGRAGSTSMHWENVACCGESSSCETGFYWTAFNVGFGRSRTFIVDIPAETQKAILRPLSGPTNISGHFDGHGGHSLVGDGNSVSDEVAAGSEGVGVSAVADGEVSFMFALIR